MKIYKNKYFEKIIFLFIMISTLQLIIYTYFSDENEDSKKVRDFM